MAGRLDARKYFGVPAGREVFHLTSLQLSLQELGQQLLSNQQPGVAKFLALVTPPLAHPMDDFCPSGRERMRGTWSIALSGFVTAAFPNRAPV